MKLIIPTIEHKERVWEYRQEFIDFKDTIHGSSSIAHFSDYESWLEKTLKIRSEAASYNLVDADTYFAMINDEIVGMIQVRHSLNEHLLKFGGHIGYSVRPRERKKGYATKMLKLALEECRKLGIKKVLITCNKDNPASEKTILKNNGIFENEIMEDNGNIILRYWITIKDYIETENLILRKAVKEDASDLFNNFWLHEVTARYMLWPPIKTLEEAIARIERTIEHQKNGTAFCVCLKSTNKAIGLAGVKIMEDGSVEDAGVGVGPDFTGKGYGTEITKALVDFSFNHLKAEVVRFGCCEENEKSAKMILKCGFKYQSLSEEMERKWDGKIYRVKTFSMTIAEWKKLKEIN
ncbi:MAG: GNAT family N-acetyltransferase [Erysipelotrichales bacterium]|nr:GNAT family N-acetyltransferase [Erysipelotrichales bacterium]